MERRRGTAVRVKISNKKRVTAGEVDTWEKELGQCTHQWTTNDEKNKQAFSTLSVFFRLKKKDNNKKKKEAEKRTDVKEATKLNQRNFNKEYVV